MYGPRVRLERGFSLLELAVVLSVLAVVVSLGLRLQQGVMESGVAAVQRARLKQAHDSLVQFALTQYRLPCPDSGISASSISGVEGVSANGSCKSNVGWLPYVTLGLMVPNGQGANQPIRYGALDIATASYPGQDAAAMFQAALITAEGGTPGTTNVYVPSDASCATALINPVFALALGASTAAQSSNGLCFSQGTGLGSLQVDVEAIGELVAELEAIQK